ncbi:MAG: 50S ribosomal protein L18 [Myxococcales bacterium]|nr:50S ribosomal protein L18 [Myxococcales bacterium]MDD9966085.1 50S ribosomal protein L18 [Myxococcales bacterium]
MTNKIQRRTRRRRHIRKKVSGTAERPRLTIFRSAKQIYAQVIDDVAGATLASASSLKGEAAEAGKVARAEAVGEALAAACKERGITQVVFDRNGYIYHGRVKAVADGARKGGLEL